MLKFYSLKYIKFFSIANFWPNFHSMIHESIIEQSLNFQFRVEFTSKKFGARKKIKDRPYL